MSRVVVVGDASFPFVCLFSSWCGNDGDDDALGFVGCGVGVGGG